MNHLWATAGRACAALDAAGLPYGVTGGIAAFHYGEPRFTQDVDVVVRLPGGSSKVRVLIEALEPAFFVDPEQVRDQVTRQGMFQALDRETFIRVDFHVGEAVPGELDRCVRREVVPGLTVPLISREDAILAKLLWIRQGSHKSRQDVQAMLMREGPLDVAFIQRMADDLGVRDLLLELGPPERRG